MKGAATENALNTIGGASILLMSLSESGLVDPDVSHALSMLANSLEDAREAIEQARKGTENS